MSTTTSSSSDPNLPRAAWARHYEAASERRRSRGWRRRSDGRRPAIGHKKVYLLATGLFVALTLVALLLPR